MKRVFLFLTTMVFSLCTFAQTNLIKNGDFLNGTEDWEFKYQKPADTSVYVVSATADGLSVSQPTTASGRLDISQDVKVENGLTYTLSFDYKETHAKARLWSVFLSDSGVAVYINGDNTLTDTGAKIDEFRTNNGYYTAESEWTHKSYELYVPNNDTVSTFHFELRIYKQVGNIANFRNISLIEKNIATCVENVEFVEQNKFFDGKQIIIIKNGEKYTIDGRKF